MVQRFSMKVSMDLLCVNYFSTSNFSYLIQTFCFIEINIKLSFNYVQNIALNGQISLQPMLYFYCDNGRPASKKKNWQKKK